MVDEARQRRDREAARAREAERDRVLVGAANPPQPTRVHEEVTSPGVSPALTGPECLSDAIRSESFPSSFKEPRKVPNYKLSWGFHGKFLLREDEFWGHR